MAFRFTLAAPLRLRQSMERREYLALEKIQSEIAATRLELTQAGQELLAEAEQFKREISGGVPAIHLHCWSQRIKSLEDRREQLQARLQRQEESRQQQLAVWVEARQKREILDKLREQQLRLYQRAEARREQILLDNFALLRHGKPGD